MRIMLVTRVYPTHRPGGMAFVCQDRAEELARHGHQVDVVTTASSRKSGELRPAEVAVDGCLCVHYTASPAHEWTPEFAEACYELARRLAPDVIHLDSFDGSALWWRGLGIRTAITLHGFTMGAFLTEMNMWRAYGGAEPAFPAEKIRRDLAGLRSVDTVVAVSRWEQRMLRDQYGLLNAKLVYNPLPPYFFDDVPRPHERSGFLAVATSQGAKRGFGSAQRAAERAGVELTVVSGTPRRELPPLYDRARALVLPTAFCQGWDLSVAEARARGCPAIIAGTGSYLEEAAPWDVLVPFGEQGALEEALRRPQATVPAGAADAHRPEHHFEQWLAAVS